MLERSLEAERERIGLWAPVAVGAGISAWFALPDSRWWTGWILLCCLLALGAGAIRGGGRLPMLLMMAALLAGVGCALVWGKALLAGQPPLSRAVFASIEARVAAVDRQPALDRVRLTVEPEKARESGLPARIRVNVDSADLPPGVGPGALIAFRSRLMPPPSPAVPGAYDFAEVAFFSGIGATGRALPPVRVLAAAPGDAQSLRQRLADHIHSRLPNPEGAIAITMATGDTGSITEEDQIAMRRSGLAHLLSISGLHVSALIAAAILLSYRLLALWPRLALRWPLMLVAAGMGALAGISYTLLTGAQVPTVRSCIAALLVLGGLALGREAISLRLVAVGALVVLLLWPEAVVGPSFQMSFMAVTVIVALVEAPWFHALTHRREEPWPKRQGRALLALFLTGMAVEIALMPIAMFHFHQAGMLGALANLVAIPLTTFVVMPAEALALLFDLVGLGAPFWWATGRAIAALLGLAHFVGNQPGAIWPLPVASPLAFVAAMAGILWLLLWRTRLRLAGLAPLATGVAAMAMAPAPDLLVSGDGRHMVLRQADGSLALLRGRAGDYVRGMFSAAAGQGTGGEAETGMPALADAANARCSLDLCSVMVRGEGRDWMVVATRTGVRLPWRAFIDICARADIVVSDRTLPAACMPRWLKLDRAHLARTGGVAIYLDAHRWKGVRDQADRHPWLPVRGTLPRAVANPAPRPAQL